MIVVDASVLAWLWLPGEMSDLAEAALKKDSEWAAPVVWRSEFRNVLSEFVRRGEIGEIDALKVMEGAELLLRGQEYAVPSDRVMQWAKKSERSAYDCEFVVLAEDLGAPFVTTDESLADAFPELAMHLSEFVASADDPTVAAESGKMKWRKS